MPFTSLEYVSFWLEPSDILLMTYVGWLPVHLGISTEPVSQDWRKNTHTWIPAWHGLSSDSHWSLLHGPQLDQEQSRESTDVSFWLLNAISIINNYFRSIEPFCLRFNGHFPGGPGLAGTGMPPLWILLELRVMELVVTTGAIRCAKLL